MTYQTVCDGHWNDPQTWKDGVVPNPNGSTIELNHRVNISGLVVENCEFYGGDGRIQVMGGSGGLFSNVFHSCGYELCTEPEEQGK